MHHELETLPKIPADLVLEETERREKALQIYLRYREACLNNPAMEEATPPNYDIRIWWTNPDTGEKSWVKRLYLPAGEVREWRMATLKDEKLQEAKLRAPDSDFRTPGNKVLVRHRAYFRLVPRLGLCVFSGDTELPGNYILGQYVGWLYCNDALAAHDSKPTDSHKLSLMHKATMPSTVSGINGGPVQPDGEQFDLRYFWKNGPGSIFNSQCKRQCYCQFVVEYPTQMIYFNAPKLFVDDEYTNQIVPEVPYRQRVFSLHTTFMSEHPSLPISPIHEIHYEKSCVVVMRHRQILLCDTELGCFWEQVRVLVATKDNGMPPRTHATVFYNPNLPSKELVEDSHIFDPASQPEPADG